MNVAHILKDRPGIVHAVGADQPLTDAVALMMRHHTGSLLVTEGEQTVSIVTERDVMGAVDRFGAGLGEVRVREVMAPRLVVCNIEDSLDRAMDLMMHNETGKRIRHLPVVNRGKPVGVISIGDVVDALLTAVEFENKLLKNYIKNWPEAD